MLSLLILLSLTMSFGGPSNKDLMKEYSFKEWPKDDPPESGFFLFENSEVTFYGLTTFHLHLFCIF